MFAVAAYRGARPAPMRSPPLVVLLAALGGARGALDVSCQIFDETMVCDSEKESVVKGEIRTCSG